VRTSTISYFLNKEYSGIGGCFRISIKKIPRPDSFFFIFDWKGSARYDKITTGPRDF
jgi:hypothetical protein